MTFTPGRHFCVKSCQTGLGHRLPNSEDILKKIMQSGSGPSSAEYGRTIMSWKSGPSTLIVLGLIGTPLG